MILDLPWPHRDLSPNTRKHWAVKAQAIKKHRQGAHWMARVAIGPIEADELHVTVTAYPPTRAAFDDDNFIARCKAYLDGIADALEVDDSKFRIQPLKRGEVVKGGKIRFELQKVNHG